MAALTISFPQQFINAESLASSWQKPAWQVDFPPQSARIASQGTVLDQPHVGTISPTETALRAQPVAAPSTRLYRFAGFDVLRTFYSVRNPIAVEGFLQAHKKLLRVLFSAVPQLNELWHQSAKPELRLVEDPDDESSSLMVYVVSSEPDAYDRLDRFDQEWWLDHISSTEGLLNFAVRSR